MKDVLRLSQAEARRKAREVSKSNALVVAVPARDMPKSGMVRAGGWGTADDFWTLVRVDNAGNILGAYLEESAPYLGSAPVIGSWMTGHE